MRADVQPSIGPRRVLIQGALAALIWPLLSASVAAAGQGAPFVKGMPAAVEPGDPSATQATLQTTARQIEAELVLEPQSAAPGAAVKVRYMISSYEDTDARVRLHIDAAPGWTLLDPTVEHSEMLLEKWENIEGELYLVVPDTARVGDRQLVRLIVELLGDGGTIQAHDYVRVNRRGGAKPGVPVISATATVGVSRMGAGGFPGAQKAGSLTMSTKFGQGSAFSLFFDKGLRENLSNFRFEEQRTRVSGNLRHAGWDVTFGNYVASPGHALAGPYVLGRGFSVARPSGPLIADLVATQPNTIGGQAGGHLVRGRVGIRQPHLSLAFSASVFGRPSGGYTTLSTLQQTVVNADEQERLDTERRLTSTAASNRVIGLGLDAELRPAKSHRFAVRTGGLWLSNADTTRSRGPAAEASYTYTSKPATFNVRWRQMPPTVQGISIFGDELAADASVRIAGDLRVVGYAYHNAADTVGGDFSSKGRGASLGIRLGKKARRLEVRANHRESEFFERNLRRTISVGFGTPVGPLTLSGSADVGRQETGWRSGFVAFYRADLRWLQDDRSTILTVTHSEGSGVQRQRLDLIMSVKVQSIELAGGAWATRGYTSGGRPGAWTSVGIPIGGGRSLTVGADYSSLTWTSRPSVRGMLAIRQGFTMPVPFVRSEPIPRGERINDSRVSAQRR